MIFLLNLVITPDLQPGTPIARTFTGEEQTT
jgi:hypothetical protein